MNIWRGQLFLLVARGVTSPGGKGVNIFVQSDK